MGKVGEELYEKCVVSLVGLSVFNIKTLSFFIIIFQTIINQRIKNKINIIKIFWPFDI